MARVLIGKKCVFESDDDVQVLDYVDRGGPFRVKCCGQVFYSANGRWGTLMQHFRKHAETVTPPADPKPAPATRTTRITRKPADSKASVGWSTKEKS